MWIGPVTDIAVEIFRDRDLGRQRAPALRDLDIVLLKNNLAAVVGNLRRAPFPFDLIKRRNRGLAEDALDMQTRIFLFRSPIFSVLGRYTRFTKRRRRNPGSKLNHGGGDGLRL